MALKRLQVGNNGRASLLASISSTALTFSLYEKSGAVLEDNLAGIPTGTGIAFVVTVENEMILCAARASGVVTVYEENTHALGFLSAGQNGRGYGGSSAASHAADKQAECRLTAELVNFLADAIQNTYTKAEIMALLNSLNSKVADFATTADIDLATGLAAGTVHDGHTAVAGEIALVWQNSPLSENGLYVVPATGAASRATDFDETADVDGAVVAVVAGTSNKDTLFLQTADKPAVGTDDITFAAITSLTKISDAESAAGTDDSKYVTIAKVVHFMRNLTNAVYTAFVNTRTAITALATDDYILLGDHSDSDKDKKMLISDFKAGLLGSGLTETNVESWTSHSLAQDQTITEVTRNLGYRPKKLFITGNGNHSSGGAWASDVIAFDGGFELGHQTTGTATGIRSLSAFAYIYNFNGYTTVIIAITATGYTISVINHGNTTSETGTGSVTVTAEKY